ncbi:MAG: YciI family protein [Ignavibacteriaceae bacterium]|nr:YciI family protein [Ignavibacteriaceae bacterium]
MKKFVLLTVGFTTPTPEIMQSWEQWFKSIKDRIIEQVGLIKGKEITRSGISELAMDKEAITGYLVINAKDIDEAVEIAKRCPMISSTKVYEVMQRNK